MRGRRWGRTSQVLEKGEEGNEEMRKEGREEREKEKWVPGVVHDDAENIGGTRVSLL